MSLTMVTITSASGSTTSLPVGTSVGYQLENIEGLDPVKATISSSNFGMNDGAVYQNSRRDVRNLVFTVGFIPDHVTNTVKSLRQDLARKMMPKSQVTLTFFDSNGTAVTTVGRVESFEAPLFVREPKATISVLCMDPDFISTVETVVNGTSTSGVTDTEVFYDGTVPTGFLLELDITRPTNEIAFIMRTSDNVTQRLDFTMALVSGDKLEVRSQFGKKGVWLTRGGVKESVLYATSSVSNFLTLSNGINYFRLQIPGTPALNWKMSYFARYGGL